ncbi:toll/interleukin-1 receptor domain-containing protein [Hyphomicrobium sp.]|jgi:hypothetical protein|uniref:toll/interleukin-1 receptor domain-containing protein n=1 Tax=Hyphomicrobium sp. TaxID=82 RepID=UPI00356659B1
MDGEKNYIGGRLNSNDEKVSALSRMSEQGTRELVFLSKATPGDNEFALWLAPRLEAAGYLVFADILSLDGGTRWRKEVTDTLQNRAVKMLLCCSDTTLASEGVQEEIGIASDLVKQLGDPKFIIPLRLAPYKKLFGIGELQYVDFFRGWAEGLAKLLATLKKQKVPLNASNPQINPNWESFRRRGAIVVRDEPERLTSNWLRVAEIPDVIRYFEATGAIERSALNKACQSAGYPVEPNKLGFLSFGTLEETNETFAHVGKFEVKHEVDTLTFVASGSDACGVSKQTASNITYSMFRQAWNRFCRERGLLEYRYSMDTAGFHAGPDQARLGQLFPWGRQGSKRSSALRNAMKGQVWHFGVTALPAFWPFYHFKLKSRVLFAPMVEQQVGEIYSDAKKMHRLRRSICKGWRNKHWHGRTMAFLELLSGDSAFITLRLSPSSLIKLDAAPMLFSSPVSTDLPDSMRDDEDEQDLSTLGRPEPEEDD